MASVSETDKARAVVGGALVADAASMGFHWLYDQARIREVLIMAVANVEAKMAVANPHLDELHLHPPPFAALCCRIRHRLPAAGPLFTRPRPAHERLHSIREACSHTPKRLANLKGTR